MIKAQRFFVQVQGRTVHYRRWGEGPAVLAIHGSPQSSRAIALQATALAEAGLCVIAPDTPGNGLSDPLPQAEPTTADYADALVACADALNLGRVGLYGFHTGASVACAFAAMQPDRTAAIAFDGLPCWTEAERADYLANYLAPFHPAWDGSHMAWLWARLEEQTVFFPWHAPIPANRMDYDVAPLTALHLNAIDLLDAGDHYRAPYRSAFTFRPDDWLPAITAPMLLAAVADDPLAQHLSRPPLDRLQGKAFADKPAIVSGCTAHLAAYPGDIAPEATHSDDRGFVSVDGRSVAWRGSFAGEGRPLVLLHGAGDSSETFAPLLAALAGRRPVIAFDLPGHGASGDDWVEPPQTVETFTDIILAACKTLGINAPTIAGQGFGGQIAARALATKRAKGAGLLGVSAHTAIEAADYARYGAPSLAAEWDGAHLLRAFRVARWQQLFSPWFARDRFHAIPQGSLAPQDVHARAIRLLKAGDRWTSTVQAEALFDLRTVARELDDLTVFAVEGDPSSAPERVERLGRPAIPLPSAPALWAPALKAL